MPVGLIVFGDKPHTDLHGTLSQTPIIFTLTLFNHAEQNDSKFWRPIGYIPNLGYRRGTSNKTHTRDKIQDVHSCISLAFQSLKNINKENGFQCIVLGHTVRVKVWIHYFIGDTKGNNKSLGQYPGNREGARRPYRDYKSVSFTIRVIPILTASTLPWQILIFSKKGNKKMKMLELNTTAQFLCMTLEMHLLKRVFHYLTIYMDRTK
jgi:hypothetical protein